MSDRIYGFEPVFAADSELLILGSFPSVKSRQVDFYYGNPRNRFWGMLCGFFGERAESAEERRSFLLAHRIALWDAVTACEITGSADASIRNYEVADVPSLLARTSVSLVLCNGRAAHKILTDTYPDLPVPVRLMPSTSPANPRFSPAPWQEALEEVFGARKGEGAR